MGLTVKIRGQSVATFRYVQVKLMETLAAWVPSTPEMEVKLLFGEHIWALAEQADALGKRTYELRLPLQHSIPANELYQRVLGEIASAEETPKRIAAIYDVMLPALDGRYREYLEATDALMDAPTVRILDRVLTEQSRMIDAGHKLRADLPGLALQDSEWVRDLLQRESAVGDMLSAEATPAEPTPVEN